MQEVIDVITVKVSSHMNDQLMKTFEGKKIKDALFQMF
jgi:hypothetical protein